MKLFYSPASPYVRKVMACAIVRGVVTRIERLPCNPNISPPELLAHNPLSKVPCLISDDGVALFDSPVICEYLDSIGEGPPMFPASGPARWHALTLQATGDGILDASVPRRWEMLKPAEEGRTAWIERQKAAVDRALATLEAVPPGNALDIGSIAVACALGYLDFRFAAQPWREAHPRLAVWFEAFGRNPAIAQTAPKD